MNILTTKTMIYTRLALICVPLVVLACLAGLVWDLVSWLID